MDGIEKITGRIAADVEREIQEISAQAAAQADEILANYKQQGHKEAESIVTRGKKSAEERQERLAGVAQLEARKAELAAKQKMIERAFDEAREKLANLPEKEYVELLAKLAVKASSSGKEQVIFSQKDRAKYGKQAVTAANEALGAKGKLTLSEESRPMEGGLILQEGDVEVNCTFETLLRLQHSTLSLEVAKLLFNEKA